MYTEDLIHNSPEEIRAKISSLFDIGGRRFYDMMMETEKTSKCVASFYEKTRKGYGILDSFQNLIRFNRPPPYDATMKPTSIEIVNELNTLLKQFHTITNGQTSAFRSDSLGYYFVLANLIYHDKALTLIKDFKFLKNGSGRIGPDSKSMLFFDMFLPFNNQHHDNRNCFAVKDLPNFYLIKGRPYF